MSGLRTKRMAISVTPEMKEKIESIRREENLPNQSDATYMLLLLGLEVYEGKKPDVKVIEQMVPPRLTEVQQLFENSTPEGQHFALLALRDSQKPADLKVRETKGAA